MFEGAWERIVNTNPLVWIGMVVALLLNFGANNIVSMLKVSEAAAPKVVMTLKVIAVSIAAILCILILTNRI